MSSRRSIFSLSFRTPVMAGVLSFGFLSLVACDDNTATPDWNETASISTFQAGVAAGDSNKATSRVPGLRFMAYNLENWLTMSRNGKPSTKPEKEKTAAIRLIVEQCPDVLGVCEIGDTKDVAQLQSRLKESGWEMKHLAYDADSHALRRLALLSRYPVVAVTHPRVNAYQMNGRSWRMSRPMLDATVEREGCAYRFVGVHLKSKREVRGADQEQIRIQEAMLVRRHVDDILEADPDVRLIAYGDFNDSRKSTALRKIAGQYGSPTYMTAIPCADSRGHRWTHHWEYQDIYSRFDYVFVSKGLKPEVDFRASYLVDDASWELASDHRALLTIFKSSK